MREAKKSIHTFARETKKSMEKGTKSCRTESIDGIAQRATENCGEKQFEHVQGNTTIKYLLHYCRLIYICLQLRARI